MATRLALLSAVVLAVASCATSSGADGPSPAPTGATETAPATATTTEPTTTIPTTEPALVTATGRVVSADGSPLPLATVSDGNNTTETGPDGSFTLVDVALDAELTVDRPAWQPTSVAVSSEPMEIALEPFVARGLRVSAEVAGDPSRFAALLEMADQTVVNTLVFDTKDESDRVLYDTSVEFARQIDGVNAMYDPTELLGQARDRGLYTITRIVTFEDPHWAASAPTAELADGWIDAADPANWQYPLDLAVEACDLGFDEVQFDYVRFPSGPTAGAAWNLVPPTNAERTGAISAFLGEARTRLHARGCGVSAAIFGIVMTSETDERLGQTPEAVSAVVDAVSPMLYPSHYGSGWLGFDDPNDHPGPVIAFALDASQQRVAPDSLLRPWLQGFYYGAEDVRAQIDEAELRGAGWILWNVFGNYDLDWLPASSG